MGSSLAGCLVYGVQLSEDSPSLPWGQGKDFMFEHSWWKSTHDGVCPFAEQYLGRQQYTEATERYLVCPILTIEGYEAGTDVTDLVQNLIDCPLEEGEAVERFKSALLELGITEEPRWYMGGYYG